LDRFSCKAVLLRILNIFRQAYDRAAPTDVTNWHQWRTFLPVRDAEGRWIFGRVWRRKTTDRGWQFKERPEDALLS